jgi:hypothetical protein
MASELSARGLSTFSASSPGGWPPGLSGGLLPRRRGPTPRRPWRAARCCRYSRRPQRRRRARRDWSSGVANQSIVLMGDASKDMIGWQAGGNYVHTCSQPAWACRSSAPLDSALPKVVCGGSRGRRVSRIRWRPRLVGAPIGVSGKDAGRRRLRRREVRSEVNRHGVRDEYGTFRMSIDVGNEI